MTEHGDSSSKGKGKGRGRPRKYAPGQSPLELRRARDVAAGIIRKRGRPRKNETVAATSVGLQENLKSGAAGSNAGGVQGSGVENNSSTKEKKKEKKDKSKSKSSNKNTQSKDKSQNNSNAQEDSSEQGPGSSSESDSGL